MAQKKSKKVYLVQKVDGMWEIILRQGEKAIKKFDTKEEAMAYAKTLAKNQDGTVLCRSSKGDSKGKFIK